ncbi:MAG: argininosuccinate lyase [Rickettsiales bacterium]|nr:argininosuccinate lyase [Rickettsiales bacterium]
MTKHTDSAKENSANPMWGGHYERAPDQWMQKINASIAVDHTLYAQDIAGSIAHATMLQAVGMLSASEGEAIVRGLQQIEGEIQRGEMVWREALEDIHMHVEHRLAELIGDVAGKLHTARSRNDQVATDFRLYVRAACDHAITQLSALISALLARAEEHAATVMPGFTHLQTAQPVTLGHHLMAYVEMLARDRGRFMDARARMNESPLGAAALAGTSFPIDRQMTAKLLGFSQPMANSLDAVGSRDFALEYLAAAAICAVNLSRMAEEFVLWSSAPFGFIRFSEAFTTGSSIMPQKRNPDAAELVRGKTGRVIGDLVTLLTTMKALPLAYNKDMQEDKEPLFDAAQTLALCLPVMRGMVVDFTADTTRMHEAASAAYSTATDLADWLVRVLQIPFRQAHHLTGRIVRLAEVGQMALHQVALSEMQAVEPRITADVFQVLSAEHSVASRISEGGTAPTRVKQAIIEARKRYALT